MAASTCRDKIKEDAVRKAVNALLKWKNKNKKSISQSDPEIDHEDETDDFIYLSLTLTKPPPKQRTLAPHRITLRHSLLSPDPSACLIVDGRKITAESAHKLLAARGIPLFKRVIKVSKLKSDYRTFESKQKLYDSFDVFFAAQKALPSLPNALGKVFYRKRRKIPVPVDLNPDGSNWKEEIENAFKSSLLCLSGGTCSSIRVGKLGVNESEEIVENVLEAIDGVLGVVPKRWSGIRCLHLKFPDSLALPIYEKRID